MKPQLNLKSKPQKIKKKQKQNKNLTKNFLKAFKNYVLSLDFSD